jgi:hypothetical protein
MMESVMIGAFAVNLLIALWTGVLACRRLKLILTQRDELALVAGCVGVFASSVFLLRFLAGPVLWGDCSSTVGSHMAILWIGQWNPWGPCVASLGLVFAPFGRGWIRAVPALSSLFLISFALFLHRIVEIQ